MLKRSAKKAANRLLSIVGWQLQRVGPGAKDSALEALRTAGLHPAVVIDVGVHLDGTPELYSTFPDSKFVLIEPAAEFAPTIEKICSKLRDAELIIAAASDHVGSGTLRITRDSYVHTGLAELEDVSADDGIARDYVEVPLVTVDEVCRARNLSGPFLLKVDVDGADLIVLKGSMETLKQTDVVIVEAPVDHLLERGTFLQNQGFVLWGIVDPLYFSNTLWQVDLIFVSPRFRNNPNFRPWTKEGFRFS